MADINIVVLVGRLTRDVELKYTNTGYAIANMSIAVNRSYKKDDTWQEEASFFNAVLFGKRAEALAQYLVKGKQIGIQGELRQNKWEQDGQPRSRVEIVINDIQLLGGRGAVSNQDYSAPRGAPARQETPMADDFDDDIPF
jgi:single-strand DNA-binding protein